MPIEVVDADGTVIEFPDSTPQEQITRVMRQRDQERDARQRSGDPIRAPGSVLGAIGGRQASAAPTPYSRAYGRETRARTRDNPVARFNDRAFGWLDQMPRNMGVADEMAAGTAWVGQNVDNAIRRLRGQPIEIDPGTAARAAADRENNERDRFARERPAENVASIVASVPAFGGNPATNIGRISAWQAGLAAAGTDAPFAVARQEGSFRERLPGALREMAAVAAFGAGAQGLANRFARPSPGNRRAADFASAGVRPTMAAVNQGASAGATKLIGENFIAGAGVRSRLRNSIRDTADASRRLARNYGEPGQPEQVGEVVQRGVERFARERPAAPTAAAPESIPTREWSFRSKADALYDRAFEAIRRDEAGHVAGGTGAGVSVRNTQTLLEDLQTRVNAPGVRELVQDPTIARVANALSEDAGTGALRFQDIRELRSWVRRARDKAALLPDVNDAALARLEGSLTQDLYESAIEIAGQTTADQLRRVDQFYRAGTNRIRNALRAFDPERSTPLSGAGAYNRIVALAREGGRQNSAQLRQLRRSLRPDEWREVASTVIDQMGRPNAGNPGVLELGAFSVETFVTNYAKLSPEGREVLFGGAGRESLQTALDTLARVASYQKGVESLANRSRSGVNVQNVGTGAGLLNPSTAPTTMAALGMGMITGEMLTNPAFVRWLTSASRDGAGVGGMRRHLATLARLAGRDPALAPYYADLALQ